MGLKIHTEKCLVWDLMTEQMEVRTAVYARIVGNMGSILFEEGPLYCSTGKEITEAGNLLRERLVKKSTT